MRTQIIQSVRREGATFCALFVEDSDLGHCSECVTRHDDSAMGGVTIHEADFSAVNLGSASRDGYVRRMLESQVYRFSNGVKS